ncbi:MULTISPECIES: hypothetical protein [Ectothiorhodospira]|nr:MULTISPECIES: hypothetical protein [Ectothiorhodospira]
MWNKSHEAFSRTTQDTAHDSLACLLLADATRALMNAGPARG